MIRGEKNGKFVSVCLKSFVPELWSDDQPLEHLTSGEIASKRTMIELKLQRNVVKMHEKNSSVDLLV